MNLFLSIPFLRIMLFFYYIFKLDEINVFIIRKFCIFIVHILEKIRLTGDKMSRKCQVTGVGPKAGNSISHAHNKSKRRFLPNLQKKKIWVQELNRFVTLKLSTSALSTINKNGTAEIAKMIKEGKVKVN